ncbi:MAG: EamA family transporter [Rectinemataceae bacterium]
MTAVLALLSALLYGTADFSGGYATRKNSVFSVMLLSQTAGILVALIAAPIVGPNRPSVADLAWGLLAGFTGSVGLAALYRGLAQHKAAIVSPVSALVGAIVPAVFGALLGERPSTLALAGAALCIPAIFLLSYEKGETKDREKIRASFLHGLVAGLGFGSFFIAVSRTSPGSGLWPLIASRTASIAATAVVAFLIGRKPFAVARRDRPTALFAGIADMGANLCFLLASRSGLLIIVTLIASLFPAPTVVLARIFQGQRISPPRAAGIALALAGVALIGLR